MSSVPFLNVQNRQIPGDSVLLKASISSYFEPYTKPHNCNMEGENATSVSYFVTIPKGIWHYRADEPQEMACFVCVWERERERMVESPCIPQLP
jgi:hypothetical protein